MAVTLIAHTEVGSGGAANIEFTSIPSTYDDLLILASLRTTEPFGYEDIIYLRFNGQTSSTVYSSTELYRNNSSIASVRTSNQTQARFWVAGDQATANTFASTRLYIPNYKNTSNHKQVIIETAFEHNAADIHHLAGNASLWRDTSAISSMRFTSYQSRNFKQYSSISLYGVTKA